jgi:hypothetical protein
MARARVDVYETFDTFAREHWLPELAATFGVWQGGTLVARMLVGRNNESGESVPYLREIDPAATAC